MTTYLGVDVGEKNHGLALASGPLATPLPSITSTSVRALSEKLVSIAGKHSASTIVLGKPRGKILSIVERLEESLSSHSALTVVLHSENLSTHDALNKLREIGAKRQKLQNDHSYAACLILEDYLESVVQI
jgi:RNase H-fold protein (predicted Holliday junction resolvase)